MGAAEVTRGGDASTQTFVGREHEMSALRGALDDVVNGRSGHFYLFSGEPGIGKSRLATEIAAEAVGRGFDVVWGRCWEAGGAPAYWPWIQCLRSLIRQRDASTLRHDLGPGAAFVGYLVPEVYELLPELSAPPGLDADGARFRLFDAVTQFLRAAAQGLPLLLAFDDLHAADMPSLLLLRFAAPELLATRAVILGMYRDTEARGDHALRSTLAEIGRDRGTQRFQLSGWDEGEIARYIETSTASRPSPALVEAVHAKTEGNPLFVGEVVRLVARDADASLVAPSAALDSGIPEGVRAVIGQRLGFLSEACLSVLTVASVVGRDFGVRVLERITRRSRRELLRLLDEGQAALVVTAVPESIGRWRFVHALIRDALYEDLTITRRVELHRRVGEALEALYGPDVERHLAELAHHFWQAARGGGGERAIDFGRRAGDRAVSMLAFEEAARLYEMALQASESMDATDDQLRCGLLLSLGDARARGGDIVEARVAFLDAAELARRLSSPELLGAAALGYGGRFVWVKAGQDPLMVPLLREAVSATERQPGPLHARLVARLAAAVRDEPRDLAASISRKAVELARRLDDPATLAYTLVAQYAATWWPENPKERLAIASELLDLARTVGDAERIAEGLDFRICAHLELGEIRAVDEQLMAMERLMRELGQPAQRWVMLHTQAMRALVDGRLDEAEGLISAALAVGQRTDRWNALETFHLQTFVLRREQGRLNEVELAMRRAIAEYPGESAFPCMLANLYCELNRPSDARTAFEAVAVHDFADIARKNDWLFAMSMLPDVARHVGDRARAATLYDLLLPFGSHVASVAAEVAIGSVSRFLGILASFLGRWDEVAIHFEEALAAETSMTAPTWIAHTKYEYGRTLLERDPRDEGRARLLLADALEISTTLGLADLGAKIAILMQSEDVVDESSVRQPKAEGSLAMSSSLEEAPRVFVSEGDYWRIGFDDQVFRVRDSKGLRYLAALLRSPGQEVLALDLVRADWATGTHHEPSAKREPTARAVGSGDAGRLLDDQAKAEYRQRLVDLDAEINEAEDWGDPERLGRARFEREALLRELSRAVGLGGRDRTAASDVERARLSVTKAIRTAIGRIDRYSPALGTHLSHTIRTGTFCSYFPDPSIRTAWRL